MKEPGLHREFQKSYIGKPFLAKANKQIKSEKVNWTGNPEHDHKGTCLFCSLLHSESRDLGPIRQSQISYLDPLT